MKKRLVGGFVLFLIIILAIGIIAVSGVVESTPTGVIVKEPFYAKAWNVNTTDVILELENKGGIDVNITSIDITERAGITGCTAMSTETELEADELLVFMVACTGSDGDTAKGDITIKYRRQGSSIESTATGSLTLIISGESEEPEDSDDEIVNELVTCVFADSKKEQKCYSSDGKWYCTGIGECSVKVTGQESQKIIWKSSCSGYGYTKLNGEDERIKFDCRGQVLRSWYRFASFKCYDGYEGELGGIEECKSADVWEKEVREICGKRCSVDISSAPSGAIVKEPFYARAWNVNIEYVTLELENKGGEDVYITSIIVTPKSGISSCTAMATETKVEADELQVFKVPCVGSAGETARGDITIKYKREGSSIESTASGSITASIPGEIVSRDSSDSETESKCGVNAFKVFEKCNADIIPEPICGNGICEVGEGVVCEIPEISCEKGKTCKVKEGKCYYGCKEDCENLPLLEGIFGEKFKLNINQEISFKNPNLNIKLNTIQVPKRCSVPPQPINSYSRTCTYKWNAQVINETVTIKAIVKDVEGEEAVDVRKVEVVKELSVNSGGGGSGGSGEVLYVQILEPSSSIVKAGEQKIVVSAKGPNKIESLNVYVTEGAGEFSEVICSDSSSGGGGKGVMVTSVKRAEIESRVREIEDYSVTSVAEEETSEEVGDDSGSGGGGSEVRCEYGTPIAVLQVKRYDDKQKTEVVKIKLNERKKVFDVTIGFLDYDRGNRVGVFVVKNQEGIPSCPENCVCDEEGEVVECVVEGEECGPGTLLCQDGTCQEECEISNDIEECDFGCLYQDKCLPFGIRVSGLYCSIMGDMKTQLESKGECENNFECKSNLCIGGECVDSGLFKRIMNWFVKIFKRNK